MPDHDPADPFDPRTQDAVRDLLADLGSAPSPLPDEVAARLDATLADLRVDRTETPDRRPSRRWGPVLVAASVLAVAGLGLGQAITGGGSDSSETASSAIAPESGPESAGDTAGGGDAGVAMDGPAELTAEEQRSAARTPGVRTDRLATDAQRLLGGFSAAVTDRSDSAGPAGPAPCRPADLAVDDVALDVRLDGVPGVLVRRTPAGAGAAVVQAWTCAVLTLDPAADPVAQTTLD